MCKTMLIQLIAYVNTLAHPPTSIYRAYCSNALVSLNIIGLLATPIRAEHSNFLEFSILRKNSHSHLHFHILISNYVFYAYMQIFIPNEAKTERINKNNFNI